MTRGPGAVLDERRWRGDRTRPARRWLAAGAAALAAAGGLAAAAEDAHAAVSFGKSQLAGASLTRPTSLQFGPDGRLYVAQQGGMIKALSVQRMGPDAYTVTATENIDLVQKMPNRNDDGTPATTPGRLVTGLLVTGTAAKPVVYAVSSDPRIGAGTSGKDTDLDTNSGILSRLTKGAAGWVKEDLVRGLPRSEENHTANGLALDGQTLYIAQGGNTNNGAPSHHFALLPEVALSAAILKVDLARTPYDLPTLDDPSRPGAVDAGDPFGGNDGVNQARLVPGGPVQVHAPGFRNPYDLVRTTSGKLFTIDNGGNADWGGTPFGAGPGGTCTNAVSEPGTTNPDELFDVTAAGTYGGHPNPTRANPANTFAGQSPVSAGNPVECDFRTGAAAGALASFTASTNGLTQYTASNFGGELQGELLTAAYNNQIHRLKLNGSAPATKGTLLAAAAPGGVPLDVTAQGDGDVFPGTVWYGDVGTGAVYVLEPADFQGGGGVTCDPAKADSDGDGYTNADETAAGTSPCSKADVPADLDGDAVSDRTDGDDDGDGRADLVDPFARDATNGLTVTGSLSYPWENDAAGGSVWALGFTGLMTNGVANYLDQFDPAGMTVGGAAGVLTVDAADEGDAYVGNGQRNAFQLGVNARPEHGPFTAHTRILSPFSGGTPLDFASLGLFVGTGTQDDYVKVAAAANKGTVVQAFAEIGGKAAGDARKALALPGPDAMDLHLRVDPAAGTVQASYTTTTKGATSAPVAVGGPVKVPASWFTAPTGLAVGILSTSTGPATPFAASWDFIQVLRDGVKPGTVAPPAPRPAPVPAPRPAPRPGPGTSTTGKPASADRVRPALTGLRLTRTTVRTTGRARGTTVRFRLSEQASVRLMVARATTGRRVGGSCRTATRSNRRAATCTRWVAVRGTIAQPMAAGQRSLAFTGRLDGRRLAPGRHRMTLVATDAAGNRSAAARATFRVVR